MTKYRKPTKEDIDEGRICACCQHEEAPVHEYESPLDFSKPADAEGKRPTELFCEVCASTFLSHCIDYPRLYGEHQHLWRSIGWIANEILQRIDRLSTR